MSKGDCFYVKYLRIANFKTACFPETCRQLTKAAERLEENLDCFLTTSTRF